MIKQQQIEKSQAEFKPIKCVVWDLDHTIWDGVLLEDGVVQLRPEVKPILAELDRRGILNSIASRNEHDVAWAKLVSLGISDYFLYPAINWNSKSDSVAKIAQLLNIDLNTFAFIDDQPFEREEVHSVYPQVEIIDSAELATLLNRPRFIPPFVTSESAMRRQLYRTDIVRKASEDQFDGGNQAFLRQLDLQFAICRASRADLQRAEELTMRTNQLNTTGYTYSYDELDRFRQSDEHLLLVSTLQDKYGPYGTIGLALVECKQDAWLIKLLLMSCRVMSRGVGTIMMRYIIRQAMQNEVALQAHFVPNGRNRLMEITYKLGGFRQVSHQNGVQLLQHDLDTAQTYPEHVNIILPDDVSHRSYL